MYLIDYFIKTFLFWSQRKTEANQKYTNDFVIYQRFIR